MNSVSVVAPAKINLFLEVIKKRRDGYHELATLFAKLKFADKIAVAKTKRTGISFKLINHSGCGLSGGKDNLAVRAAIAFKENFGIKDGLKIRLVKNSPVGAGLGGGSSDAGAVLLALCRIYKIPAAKILLIAKKLGADVPLFIHDYGFCVGEGIGEKLSPIKAAKKLPFVVLAYPGFPVSTASVFKRLKLGGRKEVLTNLSRLHKLKTAVGKEGAQGWERFLYNRLETAVFALNPEVRRLRGEFINAGAKAALMSGSGSCVFALADTKSKAERLAKAVSKSGRSVKVTCFARGRE
ncbi:MAG: 4-(cytidine 5'-diphospho)-2-C-methyl-D-erythritol kinase [Elusimicrobia bacterium]|nr:4-(cytidine 5'-diphospho)-2-C-methyl-D-erythritol kinase [Elusimicrobiota bacterium]